MSYQLLFLARPHFGSMPTMPSKKVKDETPASLNIRGFPRETLYRLKMAAAAEHRTVKDLLMELIEGKIQEMEKKGMLPKK